MTTKFNPSALDRELAKAKGELNQVASELAVLFVDRLADPDLPDEQRSDMEIAAKIIENIRNLTIL
ncbi:MAG: hypothetical protein WCR20_09730 [Verrucomicrobiota bacterium]